jgi:hypothetical protein
MSSPESLWIRVRKDIAARVSEVIDRRTVTGIEAGGKVRVISADPDEPDERPMSRVRGLALGIGDEVVTVRMPGGHDVVVAALARADEADVWASKSDVGHLHAAADITSGVLDVARLPPHRLDRRFGATLAGLYFAPHNTFLGKTAFETLTATTNRTYGVPLFIPVTMTVDAIRFEVVTAVTGSSAKVGIYTSQLNGFAGATLLASSAAIPADTTGFKDAGLSAVLTGGTLVWLAIVFSHAVGFQGFQPARTPVQMAAGNGNAVMAAVYRESTTFDLSVPTATFTFDHPLLQLRTT